MELYKNILRARESWSIVNLRDAGVPDAASRCDGGTWAVDRQCKELSEIIFVSSAAPNLPREESGFGSGAERQAKAVARVVRCRRVTHPIQM